MGAWRQVAVGIFPPRITFLTAPVQIVSIFISIFLTAQTTTSGGLAGVVTDPSNAVVPDAMVEIRDSAKGTSLITKTDRKGTYHLSFVPPGQYALGVSHAGFREEKRIVNVPLGPSVTANITLQIAGANSTITVTDDAPLLQAQNGDVSETMNQTQISELPNPGNDLTYIVQTAPGVVMNTDVQGLANFSILGMPGFSYLHTIDGMNDNDNGVSLSMVGPLILLLGQNQIQETTVVPTGYSGQFGGAAGGNVNYVTKSGANQFHGNAQYYWNGRVFNANTWFNNAFDQPRPFSIGNQWAGSFGGPLKKNKLFFFVDTEGLRLLIPQQFFVTVPSLAFETATLAHIDAKFPSGANSASHAFYQTMFDLYNAAPGAASTPAGSLNPDDRLGCQGFTDPVGLGTTEPCVRMFIENRGRLPARWSQRDSLLRRLQALVRGVQEDEQVQRRRQSRVRHHLVHVRLQRKSCARTRSPRPAGVRADAGAWGVPAREDVHVMRARPQ